MLGALTTNPRTLAFSALRLAGASRLLAYRLRKHDAVAVINLHSISPDPGAFWPPIHPVVFRGWLERALRVFEFRTFRDLERPSKKPIAILSFDDGYVDFYDHAMPILDRYGLTANINIITGAVESGVTPWNIRLYDWLDGLATRDLEAIEVPGFRTKLADASRGAKLRFGIALSRYLKSRSRKEREPLLAPLERRIQDAPPRRRMLTKEQVALVARRHEVGSHSHAHESMGFETNEYFEADFTASKRWLVGVGVATKIYAFPNGSYRPEQVAWLENQGVEHVLLVDEKLARKGSAVVPRLTVGGSSSAELELAAMGLVSLRSLAAVDA